MSTKVEWVLSLKDMITPGAQGAGATIINLNVQMKQAEEQAKRTESAWARFIKGMARGAGIPLPGGKDGAGFAGAMAARGGSFFGDMGRSFGLSLLDGIGDAATGFGKMVLEGASFREETVNTFKAILGTSKEAAQLFDHAREVATATKFETRQVVGLYTDLLAGGFKRGELDTMVAALADFGTARGFDKATQLQHALMKIRSEGKLTGDALQEVTIAGVGMEGISRNLAKALGIKEADPTKLIEKIKATMKQGKIAANDGIGAIIDTIGQTFSKGGKLGQLAQDQADTLSGVWSNLKEALPNIFMGAETAQLPGLVAIKDTMKMVTGWMNPTTAEGKKLQGVMNNLAQDLLSLFQLDPKKSTESFNKMLKWLEEFEGGVKRVTTWIRSELYPAISDAFNSDGGLLKTIGNTLMAIMVTAGSAFAKGMASYLGIDDILEKRRADKAPRYQFPSEDGRIRSGDAPPLAATLSRPMVGPENAISLGTVTFNVTPPENGSPEAYGDAMVRAFNANIGNLGRLNRAPAPAER